MKKILFEELLKFYSKKMVYAILNGTRKPSLDVATKLHNDSNIDINIWQDIKSYIRNDITAQQNKSTTNQNKDVA